MKQQCHISFVYGSWLVLVAGFIFQIARGDYIQAILWVIFVGLALWLYVRYFPALARYMGYGSVQDSASAAVGRATGKVVLYTGVGCPFCPIVKRRLVDLQSKMGFELVETDVTLRPEVLIAKGIRALPVVEAGDGRWIGNGTTDELAAFISKSFGAGGTT